MEQNKNRNIFIVKSPKQNTKLLDFVVTCFSAYTYARSINNVKAVFRWIFPLKFKHGKPYCDNRLPAERTKSQSSVPTTLCVLVCGAACVCLSV